MNTVRSILTLAAILLAAVHVHAADAPNLTGRWVMQVETPMGAGSPIFDLKQDGERITGRYQGQLGEADVVGTLKGDQITLEYNVAPQGMDLHITYSGTVSGDQMQGAVTFGSMGEGTFTGKKETPQAL